MEQFTRDYKRPHLIICTSKSEATVLNQKRVEFFIRESPTPRKNVLVSEGHFNEQCIDSSLVRVLGHKKKIKYQTVRKPQYYHQTKQDVSDRGP